MLNITQMIDLHSLHSPVNERLHIYYNFHISIFERLGKTSFLTTFPVGGVRAIRNKSSDKLPVLKCRIKSFLAERLLGD